MEAGAMRMRTGTSSRRHAVAVLSLCLAAVVLHGQAPQGPPAGAPAPAAANPGFDLSGYWTPVLHEDSMDRGAGPEIADYGGLPLNEAGRLFALSYDPSRLTLRHHQCDGYAAPYQFRALGNARAWEERDPHTHRLIAIHWFSQTFEGKRTIWMDGRPHPPDYAEYTWDGFSTGRCERGMLVVTTTHMKYGYHRRNGVPSSVKSKMTEYFIRHGTELTIMQFTEDPVYLDEILARTTDFQLNPGQNVGAPGFGFEIVDEVATWPKGYVPAWPFGTEHHEFAETLGVPYESTQGYKEASYPEYLPKLRKLMAEMPATTKPASK
jgi:hypothetical protein